MWPGEVTGGHVIALDGALRNDGRFSRRGEYDDGRRTRGSRRGAVRRRRVARPRPELREGRLGSTSGLNGLRYEPPAHYADSSTFDSTGQLFALRMSDGTVAWKIATEAGASAVSVAGDRLVLALIANGRPAIRVLDARTGEEAWTTGIHVDGTLATDGELIFAATVDHELVALDLRNGEPRWRQNLDEGTPSLAAGGGILAMTEPLVSRSGDHRVRVLDPGTGAFLWERGVPATSVGIPSTPYPVFGHGQMYMFGPLRQLMAVVPEREREVGDLAGPASRGIPGHFAVGANRVYFANRTDLEVLDPATGQQIARKSIPSPPEDPCHGGGRRVIVSAFGRPEPSRD